MPTVAIEVTIGRDTAIERLVRAQRDAMEQMVEVAGQFGVSVPAGIAELDRLRTEVERAVPPFMRDELRRIEASREMARRVLGPHLSMVAGLV